MVIGHAKEHAEGRILGELSPGTKQPNNGAPMQSAWAYHPVFIRLGVARRQGHVQVVGGSRRAGLVEGNQGEVRTSKPLRR